VKLGDDGAVMLIVINRWKRLRDLRGQQDNRSHRH
jgi:hypothetical protein